MNEFHQPVAATLLQTNGGNVIPHKMSEINLLTVKAEDFNKVKSNINAILSYSIKIKQLTDYFHRTRD